MAIQASGVSYRIPCFIHSRGNPTQNNGIPNVFSVICPVGVHNSQLGFQNGNSVCIPDSKFFRSLLHAYPKKKRRIRRDGVIVAESVANVNSGTSGSGWWDNLRGGSRPLSSDVVWPAAGAFVAMAIMELIDIMIAPKGLKLTIAPFGAVCAVLFTAPTSPAAQKYNMFVSHIGCAALGVIALAVFGPGWVARSVALAASVAFMIYSGSFHPPAAGLPILFIDGPKFQHLQWWYSIFPGAAGCILLCLMQELVTFLKKNYKF